MAERKTSRSQRQERMRLIGEISTLLSATTSPAQQIPKDKVVAQVAKRCERLESTYDRQAFDGIPRLGLVAPGVWLCQVYTSKGLWEEVIKAASGVLRILGYVVTTSEQAISIQRPHCQADGRVCNGSLFEPQWRDAWVRRLPRRSVNLDCEAVLMAATLVLWQG